MTEGRCFLPGFDEDCKDGGSEAKEWVKRGRGGHSYSFYEGSHDHTRPDTGSALAAALEIVVLSFPSQPQTLNVELTPHLVRATLHFLRTKKNKKQNWGRAVTA